MRVSDVAKRAGIAPSAVRFYGDLGILPPVTRLANGYRDYTEQDLAVLRLVVSLRRLGMAPADAGRLAVACVEGRSLGMSEDMVEHIGTQRDAIARERARLDQLEAELIDLEDTARMTGPPGSSRMSDRPIRVLFVCTGNSARSQIAEALLTDMGGDDFAAFSAGTEPKGVNPLTIQTLRHLGIDWAAARSKSVTEFAGQSFDYVITVCDRARQACPVFPGGHDTLHWGLDDPAEVGGTDAERQAAFEHTAMEVSIRLRPFVELARRARRTTAATV